MKKSVKKTTKKAAKKKHFIYTITAVQEFDIMWDIDAISEEEAKKRDF